MPKRNIVCSFILVTKERKRPSQCKASFAAQAFTLQCFESLSMTSRALQLIKPYQHCHPEPVEGSLKLCADVQKHLKLLEIHFNNGKNPALSCAATTGFDPDSYRDSTTLIAQGAADSYRDGSLLGTSFDGQKKYKS